MRSQRRPPAGAGLFLRPEVGRGKESRMSPRYAGYVARPLLIVVLSVPALAGPFAPAAGQLGSTAISKDDPSFVGWATGASIARGPMDISNPGLGLGSFGADSNALGPAQGTST